MKQKQLLLLLLTIPLLQAQQQPWQPTPVLSRLRAEQRYLPASGVWKGTLNLELQLGQTYRQLRFLFPLTRKLESVTQGGQHLKFHQQGGLVQISLPLTASGLPSGLPLQLSFSSEPEPGFVASAESTLQDYRLSYQADLGKARFEAHTMLSLRAPRRETGSTRSALRRLTLGLNAGLRVRAVQRQGHPQQFRHLGNQLRIFLEPPLEPGQSASLEIRYSGKLPGINRYQIWDLPLSGGLYYYPSHPLRPGAY